MNKVTAYLIAVIAIPTLACLTRLPHSSADIQPSPTPTPESTATTHRPQPIQAFIHQLSDSQQAQLFAVVRMGSE